MSSPAGKSIQTPLNLVMPMKSWWEAKELDAVLHLKLSEISQVSDTIGTLHFARLFDFRDHNQVGFFTTYDGKFEDYMHDFLKYLGPVFNFMMKHVVDPTPLPVEKNAEAWMEWTRKRDLEGIGFYSAYPALSVQDIKARAGQSRGGTGKGVLQTPLALVLPVKSPEHLGAATQLLTQALPQLYAAADAIGTIHSARFVPLGTKALTLISEFDGGLDQHVNDLAAHLGPLLDQLFQNVVDPPASPVQKDTRAFASWVSAHNIKPWVFYSAYPTLSVKDIRAAAAKAA
jgi:hypothetical protein